MVLDPLSPYSDGGLPNITFGGNTTFNGGTIEIKLPEALGTNDVPDVMYRLFYCASTPYVITAHPILFMRFLCCRHFHDHLSID